MFKARLLKQSGFWLLGCKARLTSVEFNDFQFVEELRKIVSLRKGDNLSGKTCYIWFHIRRNGSTLVVITGGNRFRSSVVANSDHIANLNRVTCNVYLLAVDSNVAVTDHLSSLEDRVCVAESVNSGLQSQLEQSQEVQTGVTVHSVSLFKRSAELLFEHSVVALDHLFSQQLFTVL